MAVDLRYLDDGGIILEASGILTAKDLLDAFGRMRPSEEKILSTVYQISDFRKVEKVDISTDEIKNIAAQDKEFSAAYPHAILAVVVETDIQFGMVRMWGLHADFSPSNSNVGMFRSMDEAKK